MAIESKVKRVALVALLAVALIFGVGLWWESRQRERREREAAERTVINAARDCGRDPKMSLEEAERFYQQYKGVSREVIYGTHAEAIRLNCH